MARFSVLAAGLALVLVLTMVRLLDPAPIAELRAQYFDQLQRLHPRVYQDLPVKVVDIDEESLARLGQWPWPRSQLAALVENLNALGAAAILFDVLFVEPDRLSPSRLVNEPSLKDLLPPDAHLLLPDNDAGFAAAMAGSRVVLGVAASAPGSTGTVQPKAGFAEVGQTPSLGLPALRSPTPLLPVLAEVAEGIGSINMDPRATTSVIRSVPLMWRTESGLLPSISMEGLRLALGESTFVLLGSDGEAGRMQALRIGGLEIPTGPDGSIFLHYRPDHPDLYVPAHRILERPTDATNRAAIEGRIVLIGTSAAGLFDIRTTALGESVPGVSIHAQIIEQVISQSFLVRSDLTVALELAGLLAVAGSIVAALVLSNSLAALISGTAVMIGGLAMSWVAFRSYGFLLDASWTTVGGVLIFAGLTSFQYIIADRERRMIRRSFSHYVAPEVLGEIERSGHRIQLGGVDRVVTVMFADIRNFTLISERTEATELVAMVNKLFTALGRPILEQRGTIDKFIGDAVMAFWNAPLEMKDHRLQACLAALGMRAALKGFNEGAGTGAQGALRLAIGLSSGPVCVGNVGSVERFNYSVLGNTVNGAARIEENCRHVDYDILMSADVAAEARGLAILPAGRLTLKGKSGRFETFILVGDGSLAGTDAFLALAKSHEALLAGLSGKAEVAGDSLSHCMRLAEAVDPGLQDFYLRLQNRLADFAVDGIGSDEPEEQSLETV